MVLGGFNMKFKITDPIMSYEGTPVQDNGKDLDWKQIFFVSLNNFTSEEKPTNEIKAKCFQLTKKIYDSNEPDFTMDERSFLMERVRKLYSAPIIFGRIEEFLEGKPAEA